MNYLIFFGGMVAGAFLTLLVGGYWILWNCPKPSPMVYPQDLGYEYEKEGKIYCVEYSGDSTTVTMRDLKDKDLESIAEDSCGRVT